MTPSHLPTDTTSYDTFTLVGLQPHTSYASLHIHLVELKDILIQCQTLGMTSVSGTHIT